ncbi:MAG: hypothetical protein M1840_000571 [Geoglossum simile]|nr:MAG: hypothetical protein M1840_000571 [Geoglossum simile]
MSIKSERLPRPENSHRHKRLPLPPPSPTLLGLENVKLKEEKKRLEMLVTILYKQNLQYTEVLNHHEVLDKKVRKEVDRTVHAMAGIANMQLRNHSRMRAIEKQMITDWEEFYSEIGVEEANSIEEVLGDIKEQVIGGDQEEAKEILVGMF